jgi:hypothetical protein
MLTVRHIYFTFFYNLHKHFYTLYRISMPNKKINSKTGSKRRRLYLN